MITIVEGKKKLLDIHEPITNVAKIPLGGVMVQTSKCLIELKQFTNPDRFILAAKNIPSSSNVIVDILTGEIIVSSSK